MTICQCGHPATVTHTSPPPSYVDGIVRLTGQFRTMESAARQVRKGMKGMLQVMRGLRRAMNPRKARGLRIHARRLKATKRRG